jgi:hypothetical protein
MRYSADNGFGTCSQNVQMDRRRAPSRNLCWIKRIGKPQSGCLAASDYDSQSGVRDLAPVQTDSLPEHLGSLVKTSHIGGFFQLLKFGRINWLGSFIQGYGAILGGRPLRATTIRL